MSLKEIKAEWPDFSKDIKINLGQVTSELGAPGLNARQRLGCALSVALLLKDQRLVDAITEEDSDGVIDASYRQAIQEAISIMSMNNIYYRFVHLANDAEIKSLPAKLRMMVIGNPGIAKVDFEVFCLAISAINGCGMCIESHTQQLVKEGLSKEAIQSVARIAAVIQATAVTLQIATPSAIAV